MGLMEMEIPQYHDSMSLGSTETTAPGFVEILREKSQDGRHYGRLLDYKSGQWVAGR